MTVELASGASRPKKAPGGVKIFGARLVLFWERFWPALLPALAAPFLILVISLFDLWRATPAWLHWIALALAAAALAMTLWRSFREFRFPSRREAQARLETDGHVRHAAVQALEDAPFEDNEEASPLWQAYQEDMRRRAAAARLKGPRPTADDRDPYALRYAAVGLLVVAMVAAGDDWRTRLALATAPGAATPDGGAIADLWIEPPAYTGKPPIYLARAGEETNGLAEQVNTPEGSTLIAQVNGRGRVRLDFISEEEARRIPFERNEDAQRAEASLTQSGVLRLRLAGREARWPVGVLEDTSPLVGFLEGPAATEEALLTFTIAIEDDYGVTAAKIEFRLDPDQERPLDAPDLNEDALNEVKSAVLEEATGSTGERKISLDLQSDPWAGLGVLAKVIVTDGAGQTGESDEAAVTLPARPFFNPLAKAVIEQRQTLSVAAQDWKRAGRSLDALTMAPEVFYESTTDYLLLRSAFWRVMRQNGDSYDDAVEKFWPLALQLEDEALELARQRLEAAQEALRQALENGASDQEIERLVEELRQAMNDYLTALAQSGQAAPASNNSNATQIEQSDLDQMLDSIRDLAQQGAENAARQMLSDLENMLNNLRLSQGGGQGQGQQGQGQQGQGQDGQSAGGQAGQAGELIGRQRELADQTFERGQTPGGTGDDLAQEEQGLGGDLDDLIDEMEEQGGANDPNGDAARAFGQARNDMRQAEQALRNDNFDAAADAMERAIGNLRDGAENLAREQMRQAQQGREGQQGQAGGPTDPLGRPYGRANGDGVEVPEESAAGRTRAVIEELRRRLGEQGRTEEEIDYLERLLERF